MIIHPRQKGVRKAISATKNYNDFVSSVNYGTAISSLSASNATVNEAGGFDYSSFMYTEDYSTAIDTTPDASVASVNTDRNILLSDTWRIVTSDTSDHVQIQRYDGSSTWETVFRVERSTTSAPSFTARSFS